MPFETDTTLSQLCERREDLRIQLSLASDAPRPDTRALLNSRAGLIVLEADIAARRRVLGRPQVAIPRDVVSWTPRHARRRAFHA